MTSHLSAVDFCSNLFVFLRKSAHFVLLHLQAIFLIFEYVYYDGELSEIDDDKETDAVVN